MLCTCVPPQSSREAPGTSTTRTAASLYFSPNIAIAPACRIHSTGMRQAHAASHSEPVRSTHHLE